MTSVTLNAALVRIARKADIMRLDAERHSTARQDAEEIMALTQIAQRKVTELEKRLYEIESAPISFLLEHGKGE